MGASSSSSNSPELEVTPSPPQQVPSVTTPHVHPMVEAMYLIHHGDPVEAEHRREVETNDQNHAAEVSKQD